MAYNTGNAIGSADARDLYDNAQNLDKAMNSTDPTWIDRFGVARPTFKGAESELNQKVGDAEAAATQALGYLNTMRTTSYGPLAEDPTTDPLGNPCTAGDEYFNTTYNLLKRFDGSIWRVPDINTENLASGAGSSMVGHGGQTVEAALNERLPEIGSYALLRAYNGPVTAFFVRGVANIFDGGFGVFRVDMSDTTSADNGGTVLVDASGRRWKRVYDGSVNVLWFGADRTGAVECTTEANSAVAQLVSNGGGELIAPAGTYLIDYISIGGSNISIRGDGAGKTIFKRKANGAANGIVVSGTQSNIGFFDFTYDGSEATQGIATYSVGLRADFCDRLQVVGCAFTACGERAIDFRACTRINIDRCHFYDTGINNPDANGGNAISCDNSGATNCKYVTVSNCILERFGDTAIGLPQCYYVTVANNIVLGATHFGLTPASTECAVSLNGCQNAVVTNNTITDILAFGVVAKRRTVGGAEWEIRNIAISNNTIKASDSPVRFRGSVTAFGENLQVVGNTFDACLGPVWFENYCKNFSVTGNTFKNTWATGTTKNDAVAHLRIYESCQGAITANAFYDDRGTIVSVNNIYFSGETYVADIAIHDNILKGADNPYSFGTASTRLTCIEGPNVGSTTTRSNGCVVLSFSQANVAANQVSVNMGRAGADSTVIKFVAPFGGIIRAISAYSNASVTAGTATLTALGGSGFALSTTLNTTNPTKNYATLYKGTRTFNAGDEIGVRIGTTADFAPTTADIVVDLTIEMA